MEKIEDLLKKTVIEAYNRLLGLSTEEAVSQAEGKEDTLALDAVPEQVIIEMSEMWGAISSLKCGVSPTFLSMLKNTPRTSVRGVFDK